MHYFYIFEWDIRWSILKHYDLFINFVDYSHFKLKKMNLSAQRNKEESSQRQTVPLYEEKLKMPTYVPWQLVAAQLSEPTEWFKVNWLITYNIFNRPSCHLQITSRDVVLTDCSLCTWYVQPLPIIPSLFQCVLFTMETPGRKE